tara:strand:+ start:382 stop:645 length:264 start_codon:yes stop_codon:yes gene_type:complete
MSNRLIDILDDEKKVSGINDNYNYGQKIIPKLQRLAGSMYDDDQQGENDFGYVHDLIEDLTENPHHRLTILEMKYCNKLWKKHKKTN